MDCSICFCKIDRNCEVLCSNNICNSAVCIDCFKAFIDFSESQFETTIPFCASEDCEMIYLFNNINKLISKEYVIKYVNLLYNYLKLTETEKLTNFKQTKDIKEINKKKLKVVRDSRLEYIKKTFPLAITTIVDIALKDKLNKIDKSNLKLIKSLEEFTTKCLNPLCKGILDKNHYCTICSTNYCKMCERSIDKKGKKLVSHTCNQEDLQSLHHLEDIIKCPSCKTPTTKFDGCNSITCPICKTKFDIITGEKSKFGSHEKNKDITLKKEYKLTKIIDWDQTLINGLRHIENLQPEDIKFDSILKCIFEIQEKEKSCDPLKSKFLLAKKYNTFVTQKERIKEYFRIIKHIENLGHKKELTNGKLDIILKKLSTL